MAAESNMTPNGVSEHEMESTQKSFKERLDEIPVYAMTLTQLGNIYLSLRERNETLKKAFDTGEYYVKTIAETAKPVVMAATSSALATAKPFIGEVKDPVGKLDSVASETLAKVEEKFPCIRKTPSEGKKEDQVRSILCSQYFSDCLSKKLAKNKIAESTKEAIKSTTATYIEKIQNTTAGKAVNNQVENAISFSELMVELCFSTDGSCKEDIEELDQAEEDENKGALVRVTNLKDRLKRRGTRRLMTMKPVQVTVDAVHYAQERMAEMSEKLSQGTNYIKDKSADASSLFKDAEVYVHQTGDLLKQRASGAWDKIYSTTMYVPGKALKVSGEVYVSAKEMVFAYTTAHSVTEMPHVVVEMAEKYYSTLKTSYPTVKDIPDKAVAFVMVPAEVVSEYILSSRPVQWIIPNVIKADEVKIMEDIEMEDIEREMQEGEQ